MGIQPEIREETRGKPVQRLARPLLFEGLLYFLIKHGDQWVMQSYAALAAQTHQNQAFLSAYLVVYTSLR